MIKILAAAMCFSAVISQMSYGAAQRADIVLRHGRIYTMDAARSWAESLAIKDGRIVAVGDDRRVMGWAGPSTKSIDLEGGFVIPSFIDSHAHPLSAGLELHECSLGDRKTPDEMLATVRSYADAHRDLKWIVGSTWQLPVFPDANPKKEWLDAIVPDRPVFLTAADGHSAWVNTKALQLAGITEQTPDPPAGRIERDAQGNPTGTLRESAADIVGELVPSPTPAARVTAVGDAARLMNEVGITGFNDASVSEEELRAYMEAEKLGQVHARVSLSLYADPEKPLSQIQDFERQRALVGPGHLHASTVKIFEDGVIESRTAALLQPYLDTPGDAGSPIWTPEKLNPMVERLDREGFQIHVHAIGDRAIRLTLDALEAAGRVNGPRDRRPLIAHIELFDPADVPRFAHLGVIPLFQPLWAYADDYITKLTAPKLGPERMRWIYPIHSLAVTGASLAMGSDWSVSSVNPLEGIEVAVTRQDPEGPSFVGAPFNPEERIDLPTALAAYTIGSAYANFWEKDTGSLEPGKSADLVVLSDNLFEIPASRIGETNVLLTMFEGREIYHSKDWPPATK